MQQFLQTIYQFISAIAASHVTSNRNNHLSSSQLIKTSVLEPHCFRLLGVSHYFWFLQATGVLLSVGNATVALPPSWFWTSSQSWGVVSYIYCSLVLILYMSLTKWPSTIHKKTWNTVFNEIGITLSLIWLTLSWKQLQSSCENVSNVSLFKQIFTPQQSAEMSLHLHWAGLCLSWGIGAGHWHSGLC